MKIFVKLLAVIVVACVVLVVRLDAAHSGNSIIQNTNSSKGTRDAATIFNSKCATCHGKDGRAKTLKAKFNGARNLANADWQESVTDERIFNSISNGHGKKMPAFGEKFSQAEIESLVAYVRGLKK
jgi:mono/diheme cytochrome c family protein